MDRFSISCESCDRVWSTASSLSFYEKQSLESRPCPHCGAYTLCCTDPDEEALATAGVSWSWQSDAI